jgi:hypothetical protein
MLSLEETEIKSHYNVTIWKKLTLSLILFLKKVEYNAGRAVPVTIKIKSIIPK